MKPLWVLVGVGIVFLMLAPAAGPFGSTALGLGGIALAGAVALVLFERYKHRKYSLKDLERFEIREQLAEIEEAEIGELESITCPRCYQEVHPRFRACPHCGSSL